MEVLELHVFADEHIGDPNSDIARLKKRIDYVANTKNAYCILNGDILDFATRSSIGDIESRSFNIMDQVDRTVEWFTSIRHKIICINNGNHEFRGYKKEGVDVSRMIAKQLGLEDVYSMAASYVFLSFGTPKYNKGRTNARQCYTIYANHGSGGGRKEGAKAIRLADMASICDADVYIHSHSHLPMTMKEDFFRVDTRNKSVISTTKLFVNTASNLDPGGYGEAQEYKPSSKDTPVIYLSGTHREMKATL